MPDSRLRSVRTRRRLNIGEASQNLRPPGRDRRSCQEDEDDDVRKVGAERSAICIGSSENDMDSTDIAALVNTGQENYTISWMADAGPANGWRNCIGE